jgi:hypothetical protein
MLARILALALAIYPALAFAQSSPLPGFPPGVFQNRAAIDAGGSAPLSPVAFTYQGTTIGANSGVNATFGTITIGAAPSVNRRVMVVLGVGGSSPGNVPISATFTPNSGSPITATLSIAGQDSVTNEVSALVSAVLPLGTTTALTVTFGSSIAFSPRFSVYTVGNSTLSNPQRLSLHLFKEHPRHR